MNTSQENILYMWKSTLEVLGKHRPVWEANQPFSTKVGELKSKTDLLSQYARQQLSRSIGITETKKTAREKCIANAMLVINNLQVYAADRGDTTLAGSFNYTKTDLGRMAHNSLLHAVQTIHAKATEQAINLQPYGYTAVHLAELETNLQQFSELMPQTRVAQSARKNATATISGILKEGNAILEHLDRLALNYAGSHPDFAGEYRNARQVIHRGERHEEIKEETK